MEVGDDCFALWEGRSEVVEGVVGVECVIGEQDVVDSFGGKHSCFGVLAHCLEELFIVFAWREGDKMGPERRSGGYALGWSGVRDGERLETIVFVSEGFGEYCCKSFAIVGDDDTDEVG